MMRITAAVALGSILAAVLSVPIGLPALAQQAATAPADPAVLQRGAQLYSDNCAQCHQPGGTGMPPDFPALAGNAKLADLPVVVGNIHNGKNAMPAFRDLTPEEIAAIATYVRNSWGNQFGGAAAEEVASIVSGLGPPASASAKSMWEGVYTEQQAQRGAETQSGACAKCHGNRLNGAGEPDQPSSPAIARTSFLHKWNGQTALVLFEYVRTKMPLDNPGQLTDQQVIDAIAQMFALSGAPAGDTELPPDPAALAGILITEKPK